MKKGHFACDASVLTLFNVDCSKPQGMLDAYFVCPNNSWLRWRSIGGWKLTNEMIKDPAVILEKLQMESFDDVPQRLPLLAKYSFVRHRQG